MILIRLNYVINETWHPIFWFFLLLLFVKTLPLFCQQMIFNKVIPPEGKFNPLVTCITQDINGYMWFAAPGGGFTATMAIVLPLMLMII